MQVVNPTIATKDGFLVVALSPEIVGKMFATDKRLADSAEFKRLSAGVPSLANGFGYNSPRLTKIVQDVQSKFMGGSPMAALQKLQGFDNVMGYNVTIVQDDGLLSVGHASVKTSEVLMTQALVLPTTPHRRGFAPRPQQRPAESPKHQQRQQPQTARAGAQTVRHGQPRQVPRCRRRRRAGGVAQERLPQRPQNLCQPDERDLARQAERAADGRELRLLLFRRLQRGRPHHAAPGHREPQTRQRPEQRAVFGRPCGQSLPGRDGRRRGDRGVAHRTEPIHPGAPDDAQGQGREIRQKRRRPPRFVAFHPRQSHAPSPKHQQRQQPQTNRLGPQDVRHGQRLQIPGGRRRRRPGVAAQKRLSGRIQALRQPDERVVARQAGRSPDGSDLRLLLFRRLHRGRPHPRCPWPSKTPSASKARATCCIWTAA